MTSTSVSESSLFNAEGAVHSGVGARVKNVIGAVPTWVLWTIVVLWSVPTFGLLVSSFRPVADINDSGWWEVFIDPSFTLENYNEVLFESGGGRLSMWTHFLNSIAIVLPATVIPLAIASFAAYAFAWMDF